MKTQNNFYPIFLNLQNRRVLIIGGGEVAAQKLDTLWSAQAQLIVVAKQVQPQFQDWARQKKITLQVKSFTNADLKNKDLVFCATNDEVLNAKVAQSCRKKRIWVNVVDRPPLCDFIVPSVAAQGLLKVAISSAGSSPVLARRIRQQTEKILQPHLAILAQELNRLRPMLKKFPMQQRKMMLEKILTWTNLQKLKNKNSEQIVFWLKNQFFKKFEVKI